MSSGATIVMTGYVGQDPEFRKTNSGEVATFSVALNRRRGNEEFTDWWRCVTFADSTIKVIDQFVRKGSRVRITGEPGQQKWEDRDGVERTTCEVLIWRMELDDPPRDSAGAGARDARGARDERGRGDDRGRGYGNGREAPRHADRGGERGGDRGRGDDRSRGATNGGGGGYSNGADRGRGDDRNRGASNGGGGYSNGGGGYSNGADRDRAETRPPAGANGSANGSGGGNGGGRMYDDAIPFAPAWQ